MTNQEFYLVTTLVDEKNETAEEVIIQESLVAPVVLEGYVTIEDVRILSNDNNIGSNSDMYIISFLPDGTSQTAVVQIGDGKNHYTIENVKIDLYDIDAGY